MKLKQTLNISEIVELIGGQKVIGEEGNIAKGINEIHKVVSGDITFVDFHKYYKSTLASEATIIIIDQEMECPKGKTLIIHEKPFHAYMKIVNQFFDFRPIKSGLNITKKYPTLIAEPNVVIGDNVHIGENCYIQANTYIGNDTIIGDNVIIQAGTLIATDAFYFKKEDGKYTKWTSCGRVVIEDDVFIGAGCTINRGVSGDTVLGAGTKLDSQIHIGHGVVVGKNCLIAAQTGIAGKSIIEDNVTISGQVAVAQNLRIGEGAFLMGKAGVSKSLEGGKSYFGVPAQESRQRFKEIAILRRLAKD